jgi:hypothetical protein
LLLSTLGFAQEKFERKTEIGLAFTMDAPDGYYTWRPGLGIGLHRRLSKRSGFETGLYYRNYEIVTSARVDLGDGMGRQTFFAHLNERNLMIPLLYRFQNRWVHFSLGPTFDFYMGWRQTRDQGLQIDSYSRSPSVDMGAMAKIGVPLEISGKLKILPELRLNPTFQYQRIYAGVGFTLWYSN